MSETIDSESYRIAATASSRVAVRAGIQNAITETTMSNADIPAKLALSRAVTP